MSAVVQLSPRRLANSVDRLGHINAQIALLTRQAEEIKDALKESGEHEIAGRMYRAVVTETTVIRLDNKMVRAILTPAQADACSAASHCQRVSLYDL